MSHDMESKISNLTLRVVALEKLIANLSLKTNHLPMPHNVGDLDGLGDLFILLIKAIAIIVGLFFVLSAILIFVNAATTVWYWFIRLCYRIYDFLRRKFKKQ